MGAGGVADARQMIDELIDRAHSEWPGVTFVMTFPTGEQVMLPRHLAGLPACEHRHAGYFAAVVRPFCAADPIPRARGTCRMVPLSGSTGESPEYRLELGSGEVTVSTLTPGNAGTARHGRHRAALEDDPRTCASRHVVARSD